MPLRILMLATDAHGGFGGIAQYNRDVLDALSALDKVARVVVVPRLVNDGTSPSSARSARAQPASADPTLLTTPDHGPNCHERSPHTPSDERLRHDAVADGRVFHANCHERPPHTPSDERLRHDAVADGRVFHANQAPDPTLAQPTDATAPWDLPPKVEYDLSGTNGRLAFIRASLRQALTGGGFDLIYCAHIDLLPLAAVVSRLTRAPLLLTIYGIDAWQPRGRLSAWMAGRVPDLVISISDFTLRRFQAWAGIPDARTALVPNAIRADRYGLGPKRPDLLARHGLHGKTLILTLGRMAPDERYKGFDEVIESLPALVRQRPELVYLAAGDGPDRPRLQAKAQALGVANHAFFPGHIAEADKADYYRLADAYIMPSYGEGFGFVILEALACGLPVVGSLADGTQEAVRAGTLGHLVAPQDPQALQDAILQALRQPKQVPAGLDYFSLDQFTRRLGTALDRATGALPSQLAHRPSPIN